MLLNHLLSASQARSAAFFWRDYQKASKNLRVKAAPETIAEKQNQQGNNHMKLVSSPKKRVHFSLDA
jgi:hypothetical protein